MSLLKTLLRSFRPRKMTPQLLAAQVVNKTEAERKQFFESITGTPTLKTKSGDLVYDKTLHKFTLAGIVPTGIFLLEDETVIVIEDGEVVGVTEVGEDLVPTPEGEPAANSGVIEYTTADGAAKIQVTDIGEPVMIVFQDGTSQLAPEGAHDTLEGVQIVVDNMGNLIEIVPASEPTEEDVAEAEAIAEAENQFRKIYQVPSYVNLKKIEGKLKLQYKSYMSSAKKAYLKDKAAKKSDSVSKTVQTVRTEFAKHGSVLKTREQLLAEKPELEYKRVELARQTDPFVRRMLSGELRLDRFTSNAGGRGANSNIARQARYILDDKISKGALFAHKFSGIEVIDSPYVEYARDIVTPSVATDDAFNPDYNIVGYYDHVGLHLLQKARLEGAVIQKYDCDAPAIGGMTATSIATPQCSYIGKIPVCKQEMIDNMFQYFLNNKSINSPEELAGLGFDALMFLIIQENRRSWSSFILYGSQFGSSYAQVDENCVGLVQTMKDRGVTDLQLGSITTANVLNVFQGLLESTDELQELSAHAFQNAAGLSKGSPIADLSSLAFVVSKDVFLSYVSFTKSFTGNPNFTIFREQGVVDYLGIPLQICNAMPPGSAILTAKGSPFSMMNEPNIYVTYDGTFEDLEIRRDGSKDTVHIIHRRRLGANIRDEKLIASNNLFTP
jgi:hypothetical protein